MNLEPLTPEQRAKMSPEELKQFDDMWEAFGPEELHPDLVEHVETTNNGWTNLKHPYVIVVMFGPHHHKQANRQYRAKLEAIPKALAEDNYSAFIWLHERPWRFEALSMLSDVVDDNEKFWELFSDVWADSENIFQCEIYLENLLDLTDYDEPRLMMSIEEHAEYDGLPEVVTIYRGWPTDEGTMEGRSWTTDHKIAKFFANRFGAEGSIATATVAKDQIQGFLQGRGESEVIVRPEDVVIKRIDEIGS